MDANDYKLMNILQSLNFMIKLLDIDIYFRLCRTRVNFVLDIFMLLAFLCVQSSYLAEQLMAGADARHQGRRSLRPWLSS